MHAFIRLTIVPGTDWGFQATVETLVGEGGSAFERRIRYVLPTKEDCHSLASHLARKEGFQGYEVCDNTNIL
jgi:hypothetical protein